MDAVVPWMWHDFVWCGAQESLEMLGASSSAQRVHGKAFPTNPRWWHLPRRCNDSLGHLHVVTQPAPEMTELRETTRWPILGFLPDCLECCCRAFADVDSWLWAGRTEIQNLWAFWGRELQCWQNNCKWKMSADYGWLVIQELPFGEIGRGGTTGRMHPSICFCGAFGNMLGCGGWLPGLVDFGKAKLDSITLLIWGSCRTAGLCRDCSSGSEAGHWLHFADLWLRYFYDTKVRHRSNPREAALWAAVQAKGVGDVGPFGWAQLVGSIKIIKSIVKCPCQIFPNCHF